MDQPIRTPKQLGSALRRARRQADLGQQALGDRIELRQATISGLEAGEPGTQLRTLFAVLNALEMELVMRPRTKVSIQQIEDIF